MPTSASDRLERLLAHKPHPTQPNPPSQSSSMLSKPSASLKEPIKEKIVNSSVTELAKTGAITTDDLNVTSEPNVGIDEDDEYEQLFSRRGKTKTKTLTQTVGHRTATRADHSNYNTNSQQPASTIEFIPEGKAAVTQQKVILSSNTAQSDHSSEYTGNGHPLTGRFCPLNLVAKLPYKYMRDPDDRVSRQFFANNKFYKRRWRLYYLYPPESVHKDALVLLSFDQVQKLLDEIVSTFKINVSVPPYPFTLDFYDDGTPAPILLGTSASRENVNELSETIPEIEPSHGECPPLASADLTRAYEAFHNKMDGAMMATKNKGRKTQQTKAKKLFEHLQESRNQMNRAERYFGLRPRPQPAGIGPDDCSDGGQHRDGTQLGDGGFFFNFLDPNKMAQYPFEHQSVIISIDVESYERNHGLITEIGISTLDTLDLTDLAPGRTGENWIKQIRSRHFRIKGREHLRNKDFCVGDPDAFQFGRSEFVTLEAVPDAVDSCFEWSFSVQFKKEGPSAPIDNNNPNIDNDAETAQKGSKDRNIVLLGHNIGSDLEYLQKLGSEVFDTLSTEAVPGGKSSTSKRHRILASVLESLDTALLYKYWRTEPQPRNLSYICSELGIDAWFTHNAGNDARYTLEALVKMLIKARLEQDEGHRARDPDRNGVLEDEVETEKMRRLDVKMENARQKVLNEIFAADCATSTVPASSIIDSGGNESSAWSLPLRYKRQIKNETPEISMEEQIRRYHKGRKVEDPSTIWAVSKDCPPPTTPKGGW